MMRLVECVHIEIKAVDLKTFKVIRGIKASRTISKHILCVGVNLMVENVAQDRNGTMINVSMIANVWNPSTSVCECDKYYDIEYLKDYACMSLFEDLVTTCSEITDTVKDLSCGTTGTILILMAKQIIGLSLLSY